MFDRLTISTKLILLVALPIAATILFAATSVWQRWGVAEEMSRLEGLTTAASTVSEVVHELQRERGISSGYVASGGDKFATELLAQRARTDDVLEEAEGVVAELDRSSTDQRLVEELQSGLDRLGNLKSERDAITALERSSAEVLDYYSSINADFLDLLAHASTTTSVGAMQRGLAAYLYLLHEIEFAGIERGVLSGVFARDRFAGDALARFSRAKAGQETYHNVFRDLASEDLRSFYDTTVPGDAASRVKDYERTAFSSAGSGSLGVDPAQWFRAATERIDLLNEVEQRMNRELLDGQAELRDAAMSSLAGYSVAALVAIASAGLLTFLMMRAIGGPLFEAAETVRSQAKQIVAASQQQSASTGETASSVRETTTTVDQIRQTSEMTSQKASAVQDVAERSRSVSGDARQAIEQTVEGMQRIREEVEGIAQSILTLSEKNIEIGEIVESVNAIAEQSNLLAVNASIEAAKAGDQGKGFSVVAGEVKALASQSKEATDQIRSMLADIQKSSNGAVMATEQGSKRVEEGTSLMDQLGRTIQELATVIEENADVASQISSAASQQLAGVEQISTAMTNVEQATQDNAQGASQLESTAQQLDGLGARLLQLVRGQGEVHELRG